MHNCDVCHKTFHHKSSLSRHKNGGCIAVNQNNACKHCGREYSDRSNLRRHLKKCRVNVDRSTNITMNGPIYLTRDPDFLKKLIKLKGGEEQALRAIKEAVYNKVKGEVKLFGEMYLRGDDPTQWPIVCVDAKTHYFKIKQPDGTWISDPGGLESRKRYYGNYTDGVLHLMNNAMFIPVVDQDVQHDDFPDRAGSQMDHVDLRTIQDRLHEVCSSRFNQELFASELTKLYFRRIRDIKNSKKSDQEIADDLLTQVSFKRSRS